MFWFNILIQPIVSILSLVIFPFFARFRELNLLRETCETANKAFFLHVSQKTPKTDNFYSHLNSYLLGPWGVAKYSNDKEGIFREPEDLLYASLGAVKARDLGYDVDKLEETVISLIENDYEYLDYRESRFDKKLLSYQRNSQFNQKKGLSLLSALQVIARTGSGDAKQELLSNKILDIYLYFPNFLDFQNLVIAYYIKHRYDKLNIVLKLNIIMGTALSKLFNKKIDKLTSKLINEMIKL
jgi:hypothetical protein